MSRHSIRLQDYDYSQPGAYFVTICNLDKECLFGDGMGGSRGDESCRGGSRTAPTRLGIPKRKPLGRLIGVFKTASTKRINEIHNTHGSKLWQRNYFEHIIRSEDELNRICAYVTQNPAKWEFDRENPSVRSPDQEVAR